MSDREACVYLTTDQVLARYGGVTHDAEGKATFERSRMWIQRRQEKDGFPQAVHFGSSPINHYILAEVEAWDAANLHRVKKTMPARKHPGPGERSAPRLTR